MRFKLSISRQAIFNDAKKDTPCSGKFIFTKPFCLFYIISIQTIYDYVYKKFMKWTDLWNWDPFQNCLRFFDTPCITTSLLYMASITSSEMAGCDWLRSIVCILKQNSKTNWKFENYNLICY
jgi:hypothetical protein